MEEGPANWANVELANLDTSLAILQDVIAQEAANKRQRRGYKPKKTISREDAQADVENDLNIVINHMFNITDPRPHLSVDQTLAVLRLLRKIDEFENSTITKDDFDKEFKTAMTALDGVDRGPSADEANATAKVEVHDENQASNDVGPATKHVLQCKVRESSCVEDFLDDIVGDIGLDE